jgi:hypothetical protein
MLAGSLALAVAMPFLLAPRFGDRARLLGFSVGGYLMALGLVFLLGTAYVVVSSGEVGISVRGVGGTAAFADEPVVALLLLLVNAAGAMCFIALGWFCVRHPLRRGTGDADAFQAPSGFSADERAAVAPEARRLLEARFPGLGRIQAPHFDSLLQGQIEELLRKKTHGQPPR